MTLKNIIEDHQFNTVCWWWCNFN